MSVRVITPPSGQLVSLSDLKAHLRITWTDEDAYVTALGAAAMTAVENWTQRRYLAQTLEQVRTDWAQSMLLPVAPGGGSPAGSIVSVKYTASDGSTQTLDPTVYYWDRPMGETRAVVKRWFVLWPILGDGAERVVIRFAVTGDITTVPAGVQHAVKLLVSHWYANREAVVGVENRDSSTPLPLGLDTLLMPERWG